MLKVTLKIKITTIATKRLEDCLSTFHPGIRARVGSPASHGAIGSPRVSTVHPVKRAANHTNTAGRSRNTQVPIVHTVSGFTGQYLRNNESH